MANLEQLAVVRRGKEAIDEWRRAHDGLRREASKWRPYKRIGGDA